MTKEWLAKQLDGLEYPFNLEQELVDRIKAAGLVVVYGASDDLVEFVGAIEDEAGADDGQDVLIDKEGVLPLWDFVSNETEEAAARYLKRKPNCRPITPNWDADGYSWTYTTDIPHATFDIMEDGEKYCRGIVFSIHDLSQPLDLEREIKFLRELERDYTQTLGTLAQLCDVVIPWVQERFKEQFIPAEVINACADIMEYVNNVRPPNDMGKAVSEAPQRKLVALLKGLEVDVAQWAKQSPETFRLLGEVIILEAAGRPALGRRDAIEKLWRP